MGLFDFMNAPQDPQGIDPNYGVSNQQMYDARMDSMGSLGALLLAAGQRLMPNERAQILSKVGAIPGQMNQQLAASQEAQLRGLQMQKAKTELGREQRISDQITGNLQDIPEALRPFAQANPVQFAQMQAQQALAKIYRNPTDYDQKYAAAIQAGVPENQAAALAGGFLALEKDAAGNPVLINKANQSIIPMGGAASPTAGYGLPSNPVQSAQTAQQTLIASPIAPQGQGAPAAAPANKYPYATIDPKLDYNSIFGVTGGINFATGKVQDLMYGKMEQSRADAFRAMSDYGQTRNDIIGGLGVDIPGKNLKATQKRIGELIPEDTSIFKGPSEAKKDLTSASAMLDSQLNDLYDVVQSPNYGREDKSKAAIAIKQLLRGRDNLKAITDSMGGTNAPASTTAQTYSEGMTAKNPKTNERLIYRNGKWEPL